jgi:hypothetical protein
VTGSGTGRGSTGGAQPPVEAVPFAETREGAEQDVSGLPAVEDHGLSSEWPFTCRCLDCGYVGWPNTTNVAKRGKVYESRQACPRSKQHQEMVRIRITGFVEAPRA